METFGWKWRKHARGIAYVNLGMACLTIFFAIAITAPVVLQRKTPSEILTDLGNAISSDFENETALVWSFVVMLTILKIAHFWVTYLLLKATRVGRRVTVSLTQCKAWQAVTVILLVFQLLAIVFHEFSILNAILLAQVAVYGISYYIVNRYKKELKMYLMKMYIVILEVMKCRQERLLNSRDGSLQQSHNSQSTTLTSV